MKLIIGLFLVFTPTIVLAGKLTADNCVDIATIVSIAAEARDVGMSRERAYTVLVKDEAAFKSLVDIAYDRPSLTISEVHELTLRTCLKD